MGKKDVPAVKGIPHALPGWEPKGEGPAHDPVVSEGKNKIINVSPSLIATLLTGSLTEYQIRMTPSRPL